MRAGRTGRLPAGGNGRIAGRLGALALGWLLVVAATSAADGPRSRRDGDAQAAVESAGARAFEITLSADAHTLTVRFADDVDIAVETGSVVLRFARPPGAAAFESLNAIAPDWLRELHYGYDNALLQLLPGIAAEAQERVMLLRRAARPAQSAGANVTDDGSARRLARLAGVVRGRGGDRVGARALLADLMDDFPRDVQLVIDRIEQEQALRRWRSALALYDRALALSPSSSFLIAGKAGVLRDYGPSLRLGYRRTAVSKDDAQGITVAEGRAFVGAAGVFGLRFEHRTIDDDEVLSPNGVIDGFSGSRSFTTATLEHPLARGVVGRVDLFAGPGDAGAGVTFGRGWNPGYTELRGEFNRPYLDFVESMVHDGTRHRVALQHEFAPGQRFDASVMLSASQYTLDANENVGESVGARLYLSCLLWQEDPRFTLNYYFDTERFSGVAERLDAAANPFQPLGLNKREIHQFTLLWTEQLTDYLWLEGGGGYTVDRFNGGGHNVGLNLRYVPLPGFELGVRLEQSITGARGGSDRFNSAGIYVVLRP